MPVFATFTVSLDKAATVPCSVSYATASETAIGGSDFTIESGTVSFDVGEQHKTITVPVLASPTANADKKFAVQLSAPVTATLSPAAAAAECVISTATALPPNLSVLSVAAAVITAEPAPDPLVPLFASGNQFVTATGKKVRLKGVNYYGYDGTDYIVHGLYAGRGYKDVLDQLKAYGFNVIRLPFADDFLTATLVFVGTSGNLFVDPINDPDLVGLTPLQAFDKIVGYGASIGFRFILDHHRISVTPINGTDSGYGTDGWPVDPLDTTGYLYGGSSTPRPYTPSGNWTAMWLSLARHCTTGAYATDANLRASILGFDPHNEPFNLKWSEWASLCESLFAQVTAIAPDWMIFVEGVAASDDGTDKYWFGGYLKGVRTRPVNLGAKQNKLAYSAHEYAHSVFDQTWLSCVAATGGGGYPAFAAARTVPNYPASLEAIWDQYWGFIFREKIAPLWVGEFGFGGGFDFATGAADPLQVNAAFELQWAQALVRYLNGLRNDGTTLLQGDDQGISFAYFALNPESGNPLGGLVLNSDYKTAQAGKMAVLAPLLIDNAAGAGGTVTVPPIVPVPPTPGALTYLTSGHDSNGYSVLKDASGTPFIPNSVNWYGMESPVLQPGGLDQRPYKTITVAGVTTLGILDQYKLMGFNSIRFGVCQDVFWSTNGSPADWTPANGRRPTSGYISPELNPDLFVSTAYNQATGAPYNVPQPLITCKEMLRKFAAYAGSIGLRFIVDFHCCAPSASDTAGNSRTVNGQLDFTQPAGQPVPNWVASKLWYTTPTPTSAGSTAGATLEPRNQAQHTAAIVACGAYFAGSPEVAGIDIINEPAGGSWATTAAAADPNTDLCSYYENVGAAVQAVNPDILLVCEGPSSWRGYFIQHHPGPAGDGGNDGDHSNDIFDYPGFSSALMNVAQRQVTLPIPNKVVYSPHEYGCSGAEAWQGLGVPNQLAWGNGGPKGYAWWYDYDPIFPANLPAIWLDRWGFIPKTGIGTIWIGETGADLICDLSNSAYWGTGSVANPDVIMLPFKLTSPPTVDTAGTWSTIDGTGSQAATGARDFVPVSGAAFTWPANQQLAFVPLTIRPGAIGLSAFQVTFTLGGQTVTDTCYLINTPNTVAHDQAFFTTLRTFARTYNIGINWFAGNPDSPGAPLGLLPNGFTAQGLPQGPWGTSANPWQQAVITALLAP